MDMLHNDSNLCVCVFVRKAKGKPSYSSFPRIALTYISQEPTFRQISHHHRRHHHHQQQQHHHHHSFIVCRCHSLAMVVIRSLFQTLFCELSLLLGRSFIVSLLSCCAHWPAGVPLLTDYLYVNPQVFTATGYYFHLSYSRWVKRLHG